MAAWHAITPSITIHRMIKGKDVNRVMSRVSHSATCTIAIKVAGLQLDQLPVLARRLRSSTQSMNGIEGLSGT
ncbi:hypothetical protein GJ744_006817 [Endocarpon pusillum]|uniref:Uncharacterized protein n=1 Tax=Endocarpon pusillum TaxID=364733 RepID=A0A8H7ANQ9_9EURO|nr:hypothetical protein GJ744_006817 [Endocarpon pusillum]